MSDSGVVDLTGDGHGHHIPGTPYVYRHNWQKIHGGRATTIKRVTADVGRARGSLKNASPSLIANRASANLKGKRGSDYQHLAAARLHAAAARSASSPELKARHQQMAKMHRGIATRNVGRQTAAERAPLRHAQRSSGPLGGYRDTTARQLKYGDRIAFGNKGTLEDHKVVAVARKPNGSLRLHTIGPDGKTHHHQSMKPGTTVSRRMSFASAQPGLELARHQPIDPKIKLGSGGRFKKMKAKLAARGARNPGALAAYIGRRAYGRKKFAALGAKGRAHAHSNPMEFAVPDAPVFPVSGPLDLLISRDPEDGSAVVRHRRGGGEIGRIRHDDDGQWRAARSGKDLGPHPRQRGALLELIGAHNHAAPSPYRRQPAPPAAEPLQPKPVQTDLMKAYGIPAQPTTLAAATPTVAASDGPRVTTGLGARGKTIYGKLRKRGFPHDRAHTFARRAERKAAG